MLPCQLNFDPRGQMQQLNTEKMVITEVKHMPIVKAYAEKIGWVETINQMIGS